MLGPLEYETLRIEGGQPAFLLEMTGSLKDGDERNTKASPLELYLHNAVDVRSTRDAFLLVLIFISARYNHSLQFRSGSCPYRREYHGDTYYLPREFQIDTCRSYGNDSCKHLIFYSIACIDPVESPK